MHDDAATRRTARKMSLARAAGEAGANSPTPFFDAAVGASTAPYAHLTGPVTRGATLAAADPIQENPMNRTPPLPLLALAIALAAGAAAPAFADDEIQVQITLKDHKFQPAESTVAAGKPIVIQLANQDATPAELESKELRIEKVVAGGGAITVKVRALKPGRYRFFDDYREATTQGYLVAR
jgi:plastocyanin